MAESPGDITLLLAEMKRGNKEAGTRLMQLGYGQLRRLAGHYMRDERISHTLQSTALVHEAYLRLVGQDRIDWNNRAQFMGVAAQLMRRILVDHARQRVATKRGGYQAMVDLENADFAFSEDQLEDVLAIDEALHRLKGWDPQQGQIVEMRYFGGLTVEEAAEALGVSPRTVKRDWAMALAWLKTKLCRDRNR